jgi:ribosome recycling factor
MDTYLKELEQHLASAVSRLKEDLRGMRSSRPSIDFLEALTAEQYGSVLPLNQLGSFSLVPPREVRISVWDKAAVPAVMTSIEEARAGFSVSNDGNTVRALLSPLSEERREELAKLVKKTVEGTRIEVRSIRNDILNKVRAAEDRGELSEDMVRSGKEKAEKKVKETNDAIERMLEDKVKELSE